MKTNGLFTLLYLIVQIGVCLCFQLKELSQDNIKPFIGACVEPGHICYLMQWCSRGTVQVKPILYLLCSTCNCLQLLIVNN